jgi:carboxymethylenebutenolidase
MIGRTIARAVTIVGAISIAACAGRNTPADEHANHSSGATGSPSTGSQQRVTLPPSAGGAAARVSTTPRRNEWAMIRTGPSDSVAAWVVYPQRTTKAPVVVVIHEIFGLSTWVRSVADQLAADGFIAIAPDLLTMKRGGGDLRTELPADSARKLIATLNRDDTQRYVDAVAKFGMALPSAVPKYGVVGYCWGGSASFTHAVHSPMLGAAVVYYGTSPPTEQLSSVRAPVLGLYGGNDARVNATIPPADSALKALNRTFEPHVFAGAGHGFLRAQDDSTAGSNADIRRANAAATREAWPLTVAWFRKHLGA